MIWEWLQKFLTVAQSRPRPCLRILHVSQTYALWHNLFLLVVNIGKGYNDSSQHPSSTHVAPKTLLTLYQFAV